MNADWDVGSLIDFLLFGHLSYAAITYKGLKRKNKQRGRWSRIVSG